MKKRWFFLNIVLFTLLLFALKPQMVQASGSGTQNDPYVVTTYDELETAMSKSGKTTYVKLGADIQKLNDTANSNGLPGYTSFSSATTVYLDLAGHKIYRTVDEASSDIIHVNNHYSLIISDSVGGGKVSGQISANYTRRDLICVNEGGSLSIYSGYYELIGSGSSDVESCISNYGGKVMINDGTFKAPSYAMNHKSGTAYIYGGVYKATAGIGMRFDDAGEVTISKCTAKTGKSNEYAISFFGTSNRANIWYHLKNNSYVATVDSKYYNLNESTQAIKAASVVIKDDGRSILDIDCNVNVDTNVFKAGNTVDTKGSFLSAAELRIDSSKVQITKCKSDGTPISPCSSASVYEKGYRYQVRIPVRLPNYVHYSDIWYFLNDCASINGVSYSVTDDADIFQSTASAYLYWMSDVIEAPCTHSKQTKTVTKGSFTKDGKVVVTCSDCGTFIKEVIYPRLASVQFSSTDVEYNGKVRTPSVYVYDIYGDKISSSYYTVTTPSGRKDVGSYVYTITFKSRYSGKTTATFVIVPKKTSITSITPISGGFKVYWTASTNQVTGYEIQYSTSSNFASNKSADVRPNSKAAVKITGRKSKTKYYVRMMTYYDAPNGARYYSPYSKTVTVTTK